MKTDLVYKALELIKDEDISNLSSIKEKLKKTNIEINKIKSEISVIKNESNDIISIENFTYDYKNMIMIYIYIIVLAFLFICAIVQTININLPIVILVMVGFHKVLSSFYDYIPKTDNMGNHKSSLVDNLERLFISKKKLRSKKETNDKELDDLTERLNRLLDDFSKNQSIKDNLEDELSFVDGNLDAINKLNNKYGIHNMPDNSNVVGFINDKKVLELK